jgi:predicted transcriptional regulator
MQLHVTGDLEAKLTHTAATQGRNPDDLVQDVLTRYFEEEARFIEAVKRGEAAFERGEYLTQEQAGRRLQRFLQP